MSLSIKVVHVTRRNAGTTIANTQPIKARQSKRSAQHGGKILGSELNLSGKESLFFVGATRPPLCRGQGEIHASRSRRDSRFMQKVVS